MADRQQLENALRRAHAAGDVEAARRLARAIKAQSAPAAAPKSADELTGTSLNPTEGTGLGERLAAGFGKAFSDTARGGQQLLTEAAQAVTPYYARGGLRPEIDRLRQQSDAVAQRDAPLMATGGGMVGNIAGQVTQAAFLPGTAVTLPGKLGVAAGQGAAYAGVQPVGAQDSRTANAGAGGVLGALGQGVASGASALARRAADKLGSGVRESIESARAAKIPLNVSQVTNSGPLRALQSITKYLPFSGAASSAKAQQEAFNRAVGRSFGVNAPVLSDDVMRTARQNLSREFDDIYSRNSVEVTPDVVRRMLDIEREAMENMVGPEAEIVRNQIDRVIREAADGAMTGPKYQAVRTALQTAEKAPGNLGRLIRSVRTELDDAAAQSVSPEDAARLAKVRSGWANLRTTEDALRQVSGAAGNVRPASLYPLIRKGATKEMRELAKIGQNVLKEGMGDPGTAQRLMYQGVLTGGVGAGGLATGGLAGAAGAVTGLGKLALAGALAGKALNSNTASKLLQQGRPTNALAGLVRPAPKLLPLGAPALAGVLDIGTVSGYDPNDPRYRGER